MLLSQTFLWQVNVVKLNRFFGHNSAICDAICTKTWHVPLDAQKAQKYC